MPQLQTKLIDDSIYVSAPSVIVKSGVLGDSLLPQAEMEKSLSAWNGIPLTMRHPQMDGNYVSVQEAQDFIVGYFDDAILDGDRVKGSMWLNIQQLGLQGEDGALILNRILNDVPTDVSTSYFYDRQQGLGSFKGESYKYATLNIMPDHIAILPDQAGNCSWLDGCGIPRINAADDEQKFIIRRQLLHNSFGIPSGETPMDDEQEVTEVTQDATEEEVLEVNEGQTEEDVTEVTPLLVGEPTELEAFISEVGFDAFTGAVRSLIASGQAETDGLVANAAAATGLDEAELRTLSDDALRTLATNKREKFTAVEGGLRSNSTDGQTDDGWVAWDEATQ